ncbi:MAG TPA: leucyl/phenylalanyl-tRNA--protein transferase [Sphingomicrobium sp.]|nr:leucyl/phenylalanyl-tRNA--protein transferase [Sphingomicrobium sp.]
MTTLDPRLLLQGYAMGIFPMADSRAADEVFWVEPRKRAIIPLDRFHVSRSLKRTLRSSRFAVTLDKDFAGVIAACADREETWINSGIERAMLALHRLGHAHSVEVWGGGKLLGGLYGVKLGRAFFAESMFSRATDASKVALAWLVARLKAGSFSLLDCQFMTDHLESLGAVAVPRERYAELLTAALGGDGAGTVSGTISGAGDGAVVAGSSTTGDLCALDRLLEAEGAEGAAGPGGKLIVQLLGQTS